MPPDRMTGFNPGPWNPHPGLSIWCVPGKRFATYYAIFLSENMWQFRKEWMEMWFVLRWHGSQIIWHKTGMLQQYHLTTFHVTRWSGHLSSKITVTSKHTASCLACNVILTDAHMLCTNHSSKHAKHSSYQRFKHACLVLRSRSLARRSSRLRHLLRNLRYNETVY